MQHGFCVLDSAWAMVVAISIYELANARLPGEEAHRALKKFPVLHSNGHGVRRYRKDLTGNLAISTVVILAA
jgi:hypothetical protein